MELHKALKWIVGIILAAILERIVNLIPFKNLFLSENWDWLFLYRFNINIFDLVLFFFLLFFIVGCITVLESKKSDRQKARMRKQLQKMSPYIDEQLGIKIEWKVIIDYQDNPQPSDIKYICTNHNLPLIMKNGCCKECKKTIDENYYKNYIESLLYNKRGELKKRWGFK